MAAAGVVAAAIRSSPSAAVATSARSAAGDPATLRGSRGRLMVNRLPVPVPLSTVIVPPTADVALPEVFAESVPP